MFTSNSLLCLGKLFLSLAIGLNFVSLFPSVVYASHPLVSELKDVAPSDWAYEALQLLIERYGVMTGYPDGRFRGDSLRDSFASRLMTRSEFAAAFNEVLKRVEELIAQEKTSISSNDLAILQRLRQEFEAELVTLESRVDELENRTNFLEANQFSTTTKLTTRVIFAATGGGFDGDALLT